VRRRMERNRQKLVGRDKGSLTEQQTEGTVTTTIQIRRKIGHKLAKQTLSPETGPAPRSPEPRVSPYCAAPPTRTQCDVTWYGIPGSVWPGGVSPHPPAVSLPGVR